MLEAGESDVASRLLQARESTIKRWTGEDGEAMLRTVQEEHRRWSAWHLERTLCISDEECPVEEELQ